MTIGQTKQRESGLSIVGSDVKSSFPSLSNVETARLARGAILNSKVDFENEDLHKALKYIYVVGGRDLINKVGLSRLSPRWLGERPDLLRVSGEA